MLRSAKRSPVMMWVLIVLGLVLVVVLGMIVAKRGGGEPAPVTPTTNGPTAEELAGNASGTAAERERRKETPRQRVERQAREQMERLKKLEEEEAKTPKAEPKKAKPKKPDPKPDPKKEEG